MKKKTALFLGASLLSSSLFAGTCSDGLKYDFTFFGAKDKSYVVKENTFKKATSNFPGEKLLNATLNIDAMSIDTHADLSNGAAKWPPAMATVRDNNIKNHFFKNFTKDIGKIDAKITKVGDKEITVDVTMNGVTKSIPFSYTVEGDLLKAKGELDVLAFNVQSAWEKFDRICKMAFHKGMSWTTLDVFFQVPASCK